MCFTVHDIIILTTVYIYAYIFMHIITETISPDEGRPVGRGVRLVCTNAPLDF